MTLSLPSLERLDPRTRSIVTWVVLVAVGLLPTLRALHELGRVHPDEVFQFLEPALRTASGRGFVAWEWEVGLRNRIMPSLLGAIVGVPYLFGVRDPMALRVAAALPLLALHVAMLRSLFVWGARRMPAAMSLVTVVGFGLYEPLWELAGRTLSETISTACLMIAITRVDALHRSELRGDGLAGVMAGLAFVARYGAAAGVLGLALYVAARRPWERALAFFAGVGVVLAFLGVVDWIEWGRPFHSFFAYTHYNIVSGRATATFGGAPWHDYLPLVAGWIPPAAWVGLVAFAPRRAPLDEPFFWTALTYFLITSAATHKEARFVYPVLLVVTWMGLAALAAHAARFESRLLRATALIGIVASSLFPLLRTPLFPFDAGNEMRFGILAHRLHCPTVAIAGPDDPWSTGGQFFVGTETVMTFFPEEDEAADSHADCIVSFYGPEHGPAPDGYRVHSEASDARFLVRETPRP